MKQKSLVKNFLWNFLYSGLNMIFPLITAPYVSRVLGASNLGEVDFAKSIVQWFIIFAVFGVNTYGVREIARIRENKVQMSKVFSELVTLNILLSLLTLIVYFVFIFKNVKTSEELPLFIIMSISILLNAFNIDWFYQGIEEYSYITIRNIVIKLLTLISIFIFIKNQDDYVIYGLLSVLGASLSGILNLLNSRKYVSFSITNVNIFKHLKSLSTFFLITFVISIYTNLDKTLLGFMSTTESVAYMSTSKMTVALAISLSTSISAVTMPRASYYLSTNKIKYNSLLTEIPKFIMFLTIPATVGIIMLAPQIIFIIGGNEFLPAATLLRVISVVIIFSSLSTFLQSQILVPNEVENLGLLAAILSSFVSLLVNIILIPKINYIGAGIAVVLAEITAFLSRYLLIKKYKIATVSFFNRSFFNFIVASLTMIVPVVIIQKITTSFILSFVYSVLAGVVVYFSSLVILKEQTLNYIYAKIKKKLYKDKD